MVVTMEDMTHHTAACTGCGLHSFSGNVSTGGLHDRYTPPGHSAPVATTIGSPNFGYRSLLRDLEAHFIIVTKNRNLQQASPVVLF